MEQPKIRPRYRRRRHRSRFRGLIALGAVLGLFVAAALALRVWVGRNRRVAPRAPDLQEAIDPASDLRVRPVYAYSVIPGGAYSADELEAARGDPVIAAHFQDFGGAGVRTVPAVFAGPVHVSYRKQNRVYWTRRRVRLRPGEALLTDGAQFARARCGNRISETPQDPVAEDEPPVEELEEEQPVSEPPPIERTREPAVAASKGPPAPESPMPKPAMARSLAPERPKSPAQCNSGHGTTSSGTPVSSRGPGPPLTVVPEPGALVLVMGGAGAFAGWWLWRRARGR